MGRGRQHRFRHTNNGWRLHLLSSDILQRFLDCKRFVSFSLQGIKVGLVLWDGQIREDFYGGKPPNRIAFASHSHRVFREA